MHRKTLAALCAVAMTLALAACGSSDDDSSAGSAAGGTTTAAKEQLKVGFFAPTTTSTYYAAAERAAKRWAEQHGAQLTTVDITDPAKEANQLQDAMAQGKFNGMVVLAINGPALAPMLREAKEEHGIDTVLVGSSVTPDQETPDPGVPWLAGRVMQPVVKRGEAIGKQVVDACAGIDPCKAAYLFNYAGQPEEKAMIEAFHKTVEDHPNIKVLAERGPTLTARSQAASVTQDLLQAEPDIDVIAGVDQNMAGAEIALDKAGIGYGTGPGEVRLVGIGASREGVEAVRAGKWFSTQISLPQDEIEIALNILKDAHDGRLTAPKGVDPTVGTEYPLILTKRELERIDFRGQYSA